jgi:hypothetical protein
VNPWSALGLAVKQSKSFLLIFKNDRDNFSNFKLFFFISQSQPLPFKAQFIPQTDVFTVTPSIGELLPESDDGTLIKIGFTPSTYGKVFQSQLIISVN